MSENFDFHCEHAREVYENMPDDDLCIDIADLYKILSDFSRVKILFAMIEKEICVHDISQIISMSQSSVSHQLKTLRQNKIVKVRKEGRSSFYSLKDEHIKTALLLAKEHLNCV